MIGLKEYPIRARGRVDTTIERGKEGGKGGGVK